MVNKLKEMRNAGSEEGFTLIELMIVVVIIGILAAIAIPIFMNQQKGAIAAGVVSDVKNTNTNVVTALVKYPTATGVGLTSGSDRGYVMVPDPNNTGYAFVAVWFDAVKSNTDTDIVITGKWDTYTVTGTNTNLTGSALYSVATGKIVNTLE